VQVCCTNGSGSQSDDEQNLGEQMQPFADSVTHGDFYCAQECFGYSRILLFLQTVK